MKKIIASLLVLALALSIVGCAGQEPDPTSTTDTTAPTDTTGTTDPTEEIFLRSSYSVSDQEAIAQRDTVVATIGDRTLTNGLLQIYYWTAVYTFMNEQGYYIYYYGLDPATALDEQNIGDGNETWQHYFLREALTIWHRYQALALENEAQGVEMDPEKQAELDATQQNMEKSAQESGYASLEEFLVAKMGAGVTMEDYLKYSQLFYQSFNFYEYQYDQIDITDADIESYFTENEEKLKEEGITKDTKNYGVRHILIAPQGGTEDESGNTTYSEAEWEACRQEAQQILDQWLAGDATAESFATLAKEKSTDPGSKDNGGLYEGLDADTNFVEPFKQWYLDESRQVGDTGLVKSDYGYHIMYLDSAETIWMDHIRNILVYNESAAFVNEALQKHEMETDYEKIALGVVDLNQSNSSDAETETEAATAD